MTPSFKAPPLLGISIAKERSISHKIPNPAPAKSAIKNKKTIFSLNENARNAQ